MRKLYELNIKIRAFTDIDNVSIVDIEPLLPLGQYNFKGEIDGNLTNLHPGTNGGIRMGNAWAEALYAVL